MDELPPQGCLAVIFVSQSSGQDPAGYQETADHMVALAGEQPGYLGMESVRGADGVGITVSYWRNETDIAAWKQQMDHAEARRLGKLRWYQRYSLTVARVERAYAFSAS